MWPMITGTTRFSRLLCISVIILAAGLHGCATAWRPVQGRLVSSRWSIQAPEGWMRLDAPNYEMISKDGPYLQYIFIQERPLAAGFNHTRQHLERGMLPHEMARVILDDLRADTQISGFTLLSNTPAQVGGLPGFRLVYSYRDRQGVDMKTIYYGVVFSGYFFNVRYTAARRYYFAADRNTFQQVFKSLCLSARS
jgi:hypothetical protein